MIMPFMVIGSVPEGSIYKIKKINNKENLHTIASEINGNKFFSEFISSLTFQISAENITGLLFIFDPNISRGVIKISHVSESLYKDEIFYNEDLTLKRNKDRVDIKFSLSDTSGPLIVSGNLRISNKNKIWIVSDVSLNIPDTSSLKETMGIDKIKNTMVDSEVYEIINDINTNRYLKKDYNNLNISIKSIREFIKI